MRERGTSFPVFLGNVGKKHLYEQLTTALDTDSRVQAVEVGVDGVVRNIQLACD